MLSIVTFSANKVSSNSSKSKNEPKITFFHSFLVASSQQTADYTKNILDSVVVLSISSNETMQETLNPPYYAIGASLLQSLKQRAIELFTQKDFTLLILCYNKKSRPKVVFPAPVSNFKDTLLDPCAKKWLIVVQAAFWIQERLLILKSFSN